MVWRTNQGLRKSLLSCTLVYVTIALLCSSALARQIAESSGHIMQPGQLSAQYMPAVGTKSDKVAPGQVLPWVDVAQLEVENTIGSSQAPVNPVSFVIQEATVAITANQVASLPKVNFSAPDVTYTYGLWVNINQTSTDVRNIFRMGEDGKDVTDRVPALYIKNMKFQSRHSSTANSDDGLADSTFTAVVGQWVHIAVVVNKNMMTTYFNGQIGDTITLANNGKFIWNSANADKKTIGFYRSPFNTATGIISIKQFYWYNVALTASQVTNLLYNAAAPAPATAPTAPTTTAAPATTTTTTSTAAPTTATTTAATTTTAAPALEEPNLDLLSTAGSTSKQAATSGAASNTPRSWFFASNVCVGAKRDSAGNPTNFGFYLPGLPGPGNVTLTRTSTAAGVTCATGIHPASNWGCGYFTDRAIGVGIRGPNNLVAWPDAADPAVSYQTTGTYSWWSVAGKWWMAGNMNKDSPSLSWRINNWKSWTAGTYRVGYIEELWQTSEADNAGTTCFNISINLDENYLAFTSDYELSAWVDGAPQLLRPSPLPTGFVASSYDGAAAGTVYVPEAMPLLMARSVIAVKAEYTTQTVNNPVGFLASIVFNKQVFTSDSNWKCVTAPSAADVVKFEKRYPDWTTLDFDDSRWRFATAFNNNSDVSSRNPWFTRYNTAIVGQSPRAQWIWSSSLNAGDPGTKSTAYCRFVIPDAHVCKRTITRIVVLESMANGATRTSTETQTVDCTSDDLAQLHKNPGLVLPQASTTTAFVETSSKVTINKQKLQNLKRATL